MAPRLFEAPGFEAVVGRFGLSLLLCVACGAEPAAEAPAGPAPVAVRVEAMVGGEAELRPLTGQLLGFDAGRPVRATEAGLVRGLDETETVIEFVALEEGDEAPVDPSAVVTSEAGAWLAAGNGIYALEGSFLLVVDAAGRPDWVTAGAGALSGFWWAQGTDLRRWTEDASDAIDLSDFGTPTALVFTEDRGLLRIEDRLFELTEDEGYTLRDLTPENGVAGPAVGHDGAWWVADGSGLLRRPAGQDGPWTRYTLEREVVDLASGADGALWVQTADALLRMEAPYERAVTRSEAPADGLVDASDGTVARLLQDSLQVWVDTTGPLVGFEDDVLPWLNENGCITCHSVSPGDYSNYEVFSDLAGEALSRVQSGDMPRCGAGVCPPEEQLTPEEYAILEAWIAGGRAP